MRECVCVCVRERERVRKGKRKRERVRGAVVCVAYFVFVVFVVGPTFDDASTVSGAQIVSKRKSLILLAA